MGCHSGGTTQFEGSTGLIKMENIIEQHYSFNYMYNRLLTQATYPNLWLISRYRKRKRPHRRFRQNTANVAGFPGVSYYNKKRCILLAVTITLIRDINYHLHQKKTTIHIQVVFPLFWEGQAGFGRKWRDSATPLS